MSRYELVAAIPVLLLLLILPWNSNWHSLVSSFVVVTFSLIGNFVLPFSRIDLHIAPPLHDAPPQQAGNLSPTLAETNR